MTVRCARCHSTKDIEKHHIVPKSRGGSNRKSNKRFLCSACHDYEHAKDNIIKAINNQLRLLGTKNFNSAKFTMYIMRLGVVEAFNTPEKIKKRGTYMSYWKVPTIHYSYWYKEIKLAGMKRCVICGQLSRHSPYSAKCYKEFHRK